MDNDKYGIAESSSFNQPVFCPRPSPFDLSAYAYICSILVACLKHERNGRDKSHGRWGPLQGGEKGAENQQSWRWNSEWLQTTDSYWVECGNEPGDSE